MQYSFRTGGRTHQLNPQVVGEELERIRLASSDGQLKTEDIVGAAAPKGAPLHNAFTWDNREAAHAYRLMEARWLVKTVLVVVNRQDQPAFVNVRIENAQYYQSSVVVTQNIEEWASALRESQLKLSAAQHSFEALQLLGTWAPDRAAMLTTVITAIGAAQEASDALRRKEVDDVRPSQLVVLAPPPDARLAF